MSGELLRIVEPVDGRELRTPGVVWEERFATRTATPRPGTVNDIDGAPCLHANAENYPLYAVCEGCDRPIKCADGTADWVHTSDYRAACSAVKP